MKVHRRAALADSTGLVRAPTHELQALMAPHRRVLCFQTSVLKFARQLRIRCSEVKETDQELYVVLMQQTEITEVRSASRQCWEAMRPVDQHYRICQLDHLPRVNAHSPPVSVELSKSVSLSSSASPIVEPVEPTPSPLPSTRILWPCLAKATEVDEQALLFYCSALCDFVLLQRPLAQTATPRLRQKWLRWLEDHFCQWSYHDAAVNVLVALCRQSVQSPLTAGLLDWPLAHQWQDFSCYVFAQQRVSVNEFEQQLRAHTQWIQQRSWTGFYHPWRVFQLENGAYWTVKEGDIITISARWLLHTDKLPPHHKDGCGLITVEKRHFMRTFLPLVYRLMLSDYVQLVRATVLSHDNANDLWDCAMTPIVVPLFQTPLPKQVDWEPLRLYNLQWAQNHSSPVMRALQKHERAEEERRAASRAEPQRISEAVEDLEDLGKLVPPCMASVMTRKEWPKNWDRFRLVGWFYDAGYTQEQVISFLCPVDATQEQRATVASLYQSCVKAPAKKRHKYGRVSAGCSRLIDDVYETGNVLRCHYEKEKNGERRRNDHTPLEKATFQAQCAGRAGLTIAVSHPLDFVHARCGLK